VSYPVPLIGGRNLENVTITGRGALTSDNVEWLKLMPRTEASGEDPGSANRVLKNASRFHAPGPQGLPGYKEHLQRLCAAIL
jgi:hypothetical protein